MARTALINERDLIIKIQRGRTDAFEQLYNRYASRLSVRLFELVRCEDLAADLLQDIFLKIWEMRHDLDPDRSLGALLYTIAANLSKNVFRKSLQEQLYLSLQEEQTHNPIEAHINNSEASALLQSALDRLTPRQREVFVLHKIDGKSYAEISSILGIGPSAINHLLQAANKNLRQALLPTLMALLTTVIH